MLNKKNNKVYSLTYHLILVVKYRKKVFNSTSIIIDYLDQQEKQ